MDIRVKFNLDKLLTMTVTNSLQFDASISDNVNFVETYETAYGLSITKTTSSTTVVLYAGGSSVTKTGNQILSISDSEDYVITTLSFDDQAIDDFYKLLQADVFSLDMDGKTGVILYRLNSERDKVTKTLTRIGHMSGSFKAPLGIKNIELDVVNYDIEDSYNYVYIPRLKRYYYITNIALVSKDYTRLQLQEDVLMSWADLIKLQKAFITRNENNGNPLLVDVRRPLTDALTVTEISVTNTQTGSLVNVTFDYNNYAGKDKPNIILTNLSTTTTPLRNSYYVAPTYSGLPDISSQLNDHEYVNFIKPSKLFYLVKAYMSDSAKASYIGSALWLPFDPTTAFALETDNTMAIRVQDKYIDSTGNYATSGTPLETYRSTINSGIDGVCPYLIIKDFTVTYNGDFVYREPNAYYEFYIPFAGWVKVESSKFFNKRILIYYTMDLKTGLSTAYIYNYTDKIVIWSGTCQIGIKIDLATTNIAENVRQKQANDLNMVLGIVSSAVAIGVGAYTGNGVAVAGGVLSAGKAIASNVNSNNQIFDRASMTFGTSNGALYSNKEFKIVMTCHNPVSIDLSYYQHAQGLPCNVYGDLSGYSGYTEIGEIHFDPKGENIYSSEIDEIVGLLKAGVIL